MRPRWLVHLCSVVATLLATALCFVRPPWLEYGEYAVYDTLVRATPTRPTSGRVLIVDVDERSLAAIGQWPWRRERLAALIARLRDLGAATVALDIVFAEPERYDGAGPNPETILAETLSGGRVVLGYGMTFESASEGSDGCVQHPVGLAIVHGESDDAGAPFFQAADVICNLDVLSHAAGRSGFLNAAPDPDGILRRVPLLIRFKDAVYPSLALAAVSGSTGTTGAVLRVANVNASSLLMTDGAASAIAAPVPMDGKSNVLVRYRGGKRTLPYVSAIDVLRGRVSHEALAGRIAFVGTTALGTREVVATPLDTLFTGVEVQATVADNLLQRDVFYRPAHALTFEALTVLVLGLAATLTAGRFGPLWTTVGVAVVVPAVWAGAAVLMMFDGGYLSPLFPTLGLAGNLVATVVVGLVVERRRADRAGTETLTSRRLMIQTLLSLVEVRDAETGRHSRRTRELARVLAEALAVKPSFRQHLTAERIELLATLAPLHDIGKVGVPDAILLKPGPHTPEESREMRRHPEYGREVIVKAERAAGVRDDLTLAIAKDIVFTHHERWDGTGYPQGLKGTAIPVAGRIIAVVDVYDALLAPRPYQRAMTHAEAMAVITAERGTHFDPEVVDACLSVADAFERLSTLDRDEAVAYRRSTR